MQVLKFFQRPSLPVRKLKLVHLNVRSFRGDILFLLKSLRLPEIERFFKVWLIDDELELIKIENFRLANSY